MLKTASFFNLCGSDMDSKSWDQKGGSAPLAIALLGSVRISAESNFKHENLGRTVSSSNYPALRARPSEVRRQKSPKVLGQLEKFEFGSHCSRLRNGYLIWRVRFLECELYKNLTPCILNPSQTPKPKAPIQDP